MTKTEEDHQSQSWDPDIAKETEMVENLEKKPIGVAPAEDRFFLEYQYGPRIGYLDSVDRTFARTEERERERGEETEAWGISEK